MPDWPQADRLFRSDPRWLGGDDAYSVPLGDDRTLWLFGDSFIGEPGSSRRDAVMVHNTWGLQSGLDPATAQMELIWRPGPEAIVETGDDTWLWPYDGLVVDGELLLFFMHVRSTRPDLSFEQAWAAEGSMGFFEVFGWRHFVVRDLSPHPRDWVLEPGEPRDQRAVLGQAVVSDGEHVYAFGYQPQGSVLARWPRGTDLSGLEWWCGEEGWRTDGTPTCVLPQAQTELTVHRSGEEWVCTEVTGFAEPAAAVSQRTAPALTGPWTEPVEVERITGRPPGVAIYAGKAHPELVADGLAVTHATIGMTPAETLDDPEVYVPRFVVVPR